MIKVLEAIFRRFILLLFMLLVPIIIGIGIGYSFPASYQASASLWALQRYVVIDGAGAGSTVPVTPGATQTAALTELLQSAAFDVAVGKSTDLKSTFNLSDPGNAQALNDAYFSDISKNVKVSSNGNNIYQISYTGSDPRIAAQVVGAVITQFQTQGLQYSMIQGQTYSVLEAQKRLEGDQAQLTKAAGDADTAAKNEAAYAAAHPGANLNDPQYAVLDAKRVQAQATLTSLQTTVDTLSQQIASAQSTSLFKVLDPAVAPESGSRSKILPVAGGAGMAIGVVLCVVYVLTLVRRDNAFYAAKDVQKATSYPILMQVPQLPQAAKELVIPGASKW